MYTIVGLSDSVQHTRGVAPEAKSLSWMTLYGCLMSVGICTSSTRCCIGSAHVCSMFMGLTDVGLVGSVVAGIDFGGTD